MPSPNLHARQCPGNPQRVQERLGLAAGYTQDLWQLRQNYDGGCLSGGLSGGQYKRADPSITQRLNLKRSVSNPLIPHQHDPPFSASGREPPLVPSAEFYVFARTSHRYAGRL